MFGIDARRAQKQKPLYTNGVTGTYDIELYSKIIAKNIDGKITVSRDAHDLGGGVNHDIRPFRHEPVQCRLFLGQIKFAAIGDKNNAIFAREPANDRRANHAFVARNKDFFSREIITERLRHRMHSDNPTSTTALMPRDMTSAPTPRAE